MVDRCRGPAYDSSSQPLGSAAKWLGPSPRRSDAAILSEPNCGRCRHSVQNASSVSPRQVGRPAGRPRLPRLPRGRRAVGATRTAANRRPSLTWSARLRFCCERWPSAGGTWRSVAEPARYVIDSRLSSNAEFCRFTQPQVCNDMEKRLRLFKDSWTSGRLSLPVRRRMSALTQGCPPVRPSRCRVGTTARV